MKKFNPTYLIILVLIVAAAVGGWWLSITVLEWEKPGIVLSQPVDSIGLNKALEIRFTDQRSGLKHLSAALYQDNRKTPVFAQDIQEKGVRERVVKTEINPGDLKLHDGEAIFEVTAIDQSLLKNTKTLTYKTVIDMMPPQITILSAAHNINPGGTCLAVYKLSKDVVSTGVQVDTDFYKSYPVAIDGKPCFLAFFPVPSEVQNSTHMSISAEDRGGNKTSSSIPFYIRKVKPFRSDSVNLGDNFLEQKMPEFQQHESKLRGKTPLDTFVYVNGQMRNDNFALIQTICRKSEPKQLWEGTFLRMKNGAPMALFGDKRTYVYQKNAIGNSVHMGIDLASTQNAPIEAANNGVVVHTGYLGIYGNTVIIDHGLGVFTHYSHMNAIKVKVGQKVARGEVIGNTGMSGFAGGDHLHYGMLVSSKFVNPIEWWDPHWIQDNVDKKLNITVP